MAAGLGLLALPPAVFWAMTPRELTAALSGRIGPGSRSAPPTSGELARLMQLFPDTR